MRRYFSPRLAGNTSDRRSVFIFQFEIKVQAYLLSYICIVNIFLNYWASCRRIKLDYRANRRSAQSVRISNVPALKKEPRKLQAWIPGTAQSLGKLCCIISLYASSSRPPKLCQLFSLASIHFSFSWILQLQSQKLCWIYSYAALLHRCCIHNCAGWIRAEVFTTKTTMPRSFSNVLLGVPAKCRTFLVRGALW